MKPRGPLMIEHRLIERMIQVIRKQILKMEASGTADPLFVDAVVDFVRTYADRTHHGKEEDILFRELDKKPLSEAEKALMQDLVDDHVFGRKTTKALVEAGARYRAGDAAAHADIVGNLKTLVDFYPRHIEKEDKNFFPATERYFTADELDALLEEFWEFDRRMIHERYTQVVERFEG